MTTYGAERDREVSVSGLGRRYAHEVYRGDSIGWVTEYYYDKQYSDGRTTGWEQGTAAAPSSGPVKASPIPRKFAPVGQGLRFSPEPEPLDTVMEKIPPESHSKTQQITFQKQQAIQGNPAVPVSMFAEDLIEQEGASVEAEMAGEEPAYSPQARFQTGKRTASAMPVSMLASEVTGFQPGGSLAPVEVEDIGLRAFSAATVMAEAVVTSPLNIGAAVGKETGYALRKVMEGENPISVGGGMVLKAAAGVVMTGAALPGMANIGKTGMTPAEIASTETGFRAAGNVIGAYATGKIIQGFPGAAAELKQSSLFSYKVGTHTVGWTPEGTAIFAPEYRQTWLAPLQKMGARPAQATFPSLFGRTESILMPKIDTDLGWRRVYPAGMERPALILRNPIATWESTGKYSSLGIESFAPMLLLRQKAGLTPKVTAQTGFSLTLPSNTTLGITGTSTGAKTTPRYKLMPETSSATSTKALISGSVVQMPKISLKESISGGIILTGMAKSSTKRTLPRFDLFSQPEKRTRRRARSYGGRGYSYVPNLAGILTGAGGMRMSSMGLTEFLPRGLLGRRKKRKRR